MAGHSPTAKQAQVYPCASRASGQPSTHTRASARLRTAWRCRAAAACNHRWPDVRLPPTKHRRILRESRARRTAKANIYPSRRCGHGRNRAWAKAMRNQPGATPHQQVVCRPAHSRRRLLRPSKGHACVAAAPTSPDRHRLCSGACPTLCVCDCSSARPQQRPAGSPCSRGLCTGSSPRRARERP